MTDTTSSDDVPPGDGAVAEDGAAVDEPATTSEETRGRRIPAILIAVATVLAIVATLTTWVKTQALDTDAWVEVSDELIAEQEVQEALAVYLVDQVYELLDVPAEIEGTLPRDLQGLASIAAAALRDPATSGVERLVASDRFALVWERVNRTAHQAMVRTLRDENREGISSSDGAVTLELGELLTQTATDLGLSGDRLEDLPADAGSITIFSAAALADAQTAVQILDFLSWFVFLVVVLLYALAVYLAVGRRTQTMRNVGLSLAAAGVIILLLRAISVDLVAGAVVKEPSNEPMGQVVVSIATSLIAQTAWTGIVIGLIIAVCAWLLGPSSWAANARRVTAPLTNVSTGVFVGGSVVLALLLWWWNPGNIFDRLVTGVTAMVLLGAALVTLRTRNRAASTTTPAD
ncbi:hypothetical protein [Ilumatobacter nonamiensis]|uniref:hypothetical protein n=1 Tax=Ilumatobacter nonamiensis TaxID=467093 RepID=UPI0003489E2A|nr:hypothetical protein [Ilumatobacter nonamiensis]